MVHGLESRRDLGEMLGSLAEQEPCFSGAVCFGENEGLTLPKET